jgi:hypothetical protein
LTLNFATGWTRIKQETLTDDHRQSGTENSPEKKTPEKETPEN